MSCTKPCSSSVWGIWRPASARVSSSTIFRVFSEADLNVFIETELFLRRTVLGHHGEQTGQFNAGDETFVLNADHSLPTRLLSFVMEPHGLYCIEAGRFDRMRKFLEGTLLGSTKSVPGKNLKMVLS